MNPSAERVIEARRLSQQKAKKKAKAARARALQTVEAEESKAT